MVLNAAVQALREADQLKQKVLVFNGSAIPLPERTLMLTQLQKAYQKILLMDLDYALDKKVEQDLWNVGFKIQIELLQNNTRDKKNPRRAESQTMLSWVLQAATGFYICLLHQICTAFKLNLPFRVSIPAPGAAPLVSGAPQPASCWYVCQHCLVHLGDLARYSRQPRRADSFYRQALSVSPRNGQPYNQLGLLRAARGDRLGAAYYHARGLAVGGPFPPAANNLTRTLAIQGASVTVITPPIRGMHSSAAAPARLNPRTYTSSYIAVHHSLQTMTQLTQAEEMAAGLSSTLTALVATDEFHSDTLIKMCCLDLYAIYSITDGHKLPSTALTQDEARVLSLGMELVAGGLAALLLPAHTREPLEMLTYPALPAVKVLLEWIRLHSEVLKEPSFVSRLQLWPGLCTLLNSLQECIKDFSGEEYETIPLPEDEELQGYLPIDLAFSKLKYSNCASSPLFSTGNIDNLVLPTSLQSENNLEGILNKELLTRKRSSRFPSVEIENLKKDKNFLDRLRAYRLIDLGVWLAAYQKENGTEYINISMKDEMKVFTPIQNTLESNPELMKTIEELSLLREKRLSGELTIRNEGTCKIIDDVEDNLSDSETKPLKGGTLKSSTERLDAVVPPPVIISEADFREKVIEKRAGILKPQGSLERARGEKMLSRAARIDVVSPDSAAGIADLLPDNTASQDAGSGSSTVSQDGAICTDVGSLLEPPAPKDKEGPPGRREGRKTRTNVAMQAIMRKQEENSKQVKFLTPVTTPEPMSETNLSPPTKDQHDKKKIIQPKVIKSLASIPTDRKTGGILSLKDKSAGYPHLVNTEHITTELNKTENPELLGTGTEESPTKAATAAVKIQEKMEPKLIPGQSEGKHLTSPSKNLITKTFDSSPGKNPIEANGVNAIHRPTYAPWSDGTSVNRALFQNDPYMMLNQPDSKFSAVNQKYGLPNQQKQTSPMCFSYFSSPDNQNTGITLPVVNPKEIDIRSLALQKQKSSQLGMGDGAQVSDQYINKMPQYSYWEGQSATQNNLNMNRDTNTMRNNLPPRLANLYKNKSMEYPGRMQEQTASGYRYPTYQYERNPGQGPTQPPNPTQTQAAWNSQPPTSVPPQPPTNWWKGNNPDLGYESNYPQHNIENSNNYNNYYAQHQPTNVGNTEYGDQKGPMNNYGQQNRNIPGNAPGSRYSNPGVNMGQQPILNANYQNTNYYSQPSNNPYNKPLGYGSQTAYSAGMYPQFSNKFGFSQQQMAKPQMPNDYPMNSYTARTTEYGIMPNPNMNMKDNSPDMFMDSGRLGNQFSKELHHSLPDTSSGRQPGIPEFIPKRVSLESAKNFEGGSSPSGDSRSVGIKDNTYMHFPEPVVSGGANTYSLFSGSSEASNAPAHSAITPQQSLWSGPGPSPLERLLEQQKQLKYPPTE